MADVLIRNLSEDLVAKLKARASANNRSLQAELTSILTAAARPTWQEWLEEAAAFRERSKEWGISDDSTDLIREDRDSR